MFKSKYELYNRVIQYTVQQPSPSRPNSLSQPTGPAYRLSLQASYMIGSRMHIKRSTPSDKLNQRISQIIQCFELSDVLNRGYYWCLKPSDVLYQNASRTVLVPDEWADVRNRHFHLMTSVADNFSTCSRRNVYCRLRGPSFLRKSEHI